MGQLRARDVRNEKGPEIGAVHLASGFLISEMLGCRVEYYEVRHRKSFRHIAKICP